MIFAIIFIRHYAAIDAAAIIDAAMPLSFSLFFHAATRRFSPPPLIATRYAIDAFGHYYFRYFHSIADALMLTLIFTPLLSLPLMLTPRYFRYAIAAERFSLFCRHYFTLPFSPRSAR